MARLPSERIRGRRAVELRKRRLEAEPICRDCAVRGRVTAATVPDHIVPLGKTAVTTTEQKQAPLDIRLHLPERGVFTKAQLAEILDGINREAGDRGMRLLVVK